MARYAQVDWGRANAPEAAAKVVACVSMNCDAMRVRMPDAPAMGAEMKES